MKNPIRCGAVRCGAMYLLLGTSSVACYLAVVRRAVLCWFVGVRGCACVCVF